MTDIVAFLTARLDEREALAQHSGPARVAWLTYRDEAGGMRYTTVAASNDGEYWAADGRELPAPASARVIYDPACVLADVKAKRALIEDWLTRAEHHRRDGYDAAAGSAWGAMSNVLVILAGVHRAHPDYAGDSVYDWTWPDDDPARSTS